MYEPTNSEKCRQVVCSQRKAVLIVVGVMVFIFIISLIAAMARPSTITCTDKQPAVESENETVQDYLATDGTVFPWKDIRLPQSIVPHAYDIHMHPNLTTFQFKGQVAIVLEVTEAMSFLVLHSKHLNITEYELHGTNTDKTVTIVENHEYIPHEQIYLKLSSQLQPKQNYTLTINFQASLSTHLTGFYRSSYKTREGETRWLATTHFEPTDARAAFPCLDEPALKASFKMSMVRDDQHLSLFNTPLVESVPTDDGFLEDRFEESVHMSSYLVAFVVCDYGSKTLTSSKGVKVSVYAPEEQIDQADVALDAAVDIIDFYSEFFGVPYPLPKQDLIAIPDFAAGAMENWGLITYRMTALLYDPEQSSEGNRQWVAVVVAHELAHQWFGNLVTMEWWNDLWLNEGFASFVEYIGTDHHEKSWSMLDQFVTDALTTALRSDSLSSSHPISVTVTDPNQINEIFDQISYDKGSSIIRMLESVVGANNLKAGLQHYLDKHKYNNARTDDLWSALTLVTRESGRDINVKEVMDTWTLQMGYPVVKVTRDNGKVTATQERFLLNPRGNLSTEFKSPYNYKWQVPLTYITNEQPDATAATENTIWLKQATTTFDISGNPAWIKLNAGMKGFYRVHYEDEDWRALISQLHSDHTVFGAADRANLLDDAFALSSAGYLNITLALEMTKYLVQETEYVPWRVALDNLNYIMFMLEEKPDFQLYADYVKQLLGELITSVGWEDEGSHLQKYLRGLVLRTAVSMSHEQSVRTAKAKFSDWMHNGTQVAPNLKSVVYHAGISHGGEEEWQFVWSKYLETDVPSEKNKLLYALAATTDSLRLNRFLHMSLESDQIRKGDTVTVVSHVAAHAAGRVLAWRFVRQNWNQFLERYGDGSFDMSNLVMRTTSRFSTQYDYDEVRDFYASHDSGSGRRAVSQVLESIEMNKDWRMLSEAACVQWLRTDAVIALPLGDD